MDVPRSIGRYDVVRLLGRAPQVFLARDTVLGREVTLKVVRDDAGRPGALFAQVREAARAAAAVSHPNLAALHDMGEEPGVGLYLVFEYVRGASLRERIQRGPIDVAAVARIAREIGGALDAAHDAGVVHRDVTPESILVADGGSKLTDFALAYDEGSSDGAAATHAYRAPESLLSGEYSRFSDQFALAVTLDEALVGARTFLGAAPLLVAKTVLARGMDKSPQRRFRSCLELAEALCAALETADTAISPPSFPAPPPRSIAPSTRRAQNLFAAAAVLLIMALLLLGKKRVVPPAEVRTSPPTLRSADAAPFAVEPP